jgi:hypothetical protein
MGDNGGIADNFKNIKVWKLTAGDYSNIVFTEYDEILKWIEAEIQNGSGGDEFEYLVSIDYMSQQEIDALPEAD